MTNPAAQALTPEQITQALREIAAGGSTSDTQKTDWFLVTCKECGESRKYPITYTLPGGDVQAQRLKFDVIKWSHENGYGKPGSQRDDERTDIDVNIDTLDPLRRTELRRSILRQHPEAGAITGLRGVSTRTPARAKT